MRSNLVGIIQLCLIAAGAVAQTPVPTTHPSSSPSVEGIAEVTVFEVSSDGKWALYGIQTPDREGSAFHLVDLKSQKEEDLSKLAPAASSGHISPDGKRVCCVVHMQDRSCSLLVLDVATHKVQKIHQGKTLAARWVGNRLAITEINAAGDVLPPKLWDPNTMTMTEAPVKGIVEESDLSGNYRAVRTIDGAMNDSWGVADLMKTSTVVLDQDWKKLRVIGKACLLSCFSPHGKYIAMCLDDAPYTVLIALSMSEDRRWEWELQGKAEAIGVTDTGELVVAQKLPSGLINVLARKSQEVPATVLKKNVAAATLSGGTVYTLVFDKGAAKITSAGAVVQRPS